jgi:hypothetical protein
MATRAAESGSALPTLQDEVGALFARRQWGFSEAADAPVLVSELTGPHGSWLLCVQVVEETGVLLFYSVLPGVVPERRRRHVAELLTRINHGLTMGCFELDYDDGEVRSKIALPVSGRPLDEDLVERCIRVSSRLTETFMHAIGAVARGADPHVEAANVAGVGTGAAARDL